MMAAWTRVMTMDLEKGEQASGVRARAKTRTLIQVFTNSINLYGWYPRHWSYRVKDIMLFPEELLVWWTKLRWIDTLTFQSVMWRFSSLLLRGKWFGTLTLLGKLGLKNLYHFLQSGPSWSCLLAFWWERCSVKDKLSSVDSSLPSTWKELSRKIHCLLQFWPLKKHQHLKFFSAPWILFIFLLLPPLLLLH